MPLADWPQLYRAFWKALRATVNSAKKHSLWLVLLAGLILWGWMDVRQRGFIRHDSPDDHKTDLTVYTEAAAAFFDGRRPYEVANPRGWTYLYPPIFALLVAPLRYLQPQDQVFVWFLFSLVFCFGCYAEMRRLFRAVAAQPGGTDSPAECPALPRTDAERPPADCGAANLLTLGQSNFSACEPVGYRSALAPMLGWLAVAAAALPTLNCLQRGQVGVLKLYLLLLGVRLVLTGRSGLTCLAGGAILALPVVMKIIPAVPVGVFLVALAASGWAAGRGRSGAGPQIDPGKTQLAQCTIPPVHRARMALVGAVVGVLLFALLVPSALLGWKNNLEHLKTWADMMLAKADDGGLDPRSGNSRSARNQSLHNAVVRLGNFAMYLAGAGPDDQDVPLTAQQPLPPMPMDHPAAQYSLIFARAVLLAAVLTVAWQLGRAGSRLDLANALGLGCVAMLVISPIARGHYFMLYVPAVVFLPLWLQQRGDPRVRGKSLAMVLTVIPPLLVVAHYALLPVAGRMGLLGLGTAGWLLTALVTCDRLMAVSRNRTVADGATDDHRLLRLTAADLPQQRAAA